MAGIIYGCNKSIEYEKASTEPPEGREGGDDDDI